MKIALSTIGKFHTFDLARELHKYDALSAVFTGYPLFKLQQENLPTSLIHSFPYLHAPYMRFPFWNVVGKRAKQQWEYWDRISFDWYVSNNIPECDVFSGLSGSAIKTGLVVKQRGGKYVCDRGSSHIRMQEHILKEEHERWNIPYFSIDPRIIEREEAEYELADIITVPSDFVYQSFVEYGISEKKLRLIPYGVNLSRFEKVGNPDNGRFDVLFVGALNLRKGLPDLLTAYKNLTHENKSLTLIGSVDNHLISYLKKFNLLTQDINILGHIPQVRLKEIMSKSHILVLPSLEEGLAMVQAQAMACGCPVIATTNTGASNLYSDCVEGYIVPIRNPDALTEKMQKLADNPDIQHEMSIAALEKVHSIGGWSEYGKASFDCFTTLINKSLS